MSKTTLITEYSKVKKIKQMETFIMIKNMPKAHETSQIGKARTF